MEVYFYLTITKKLHAWQNFVARLTIFTFTISTPPFTDKKDYGENNRLRKTIFLLPDTKQKEVKETFDPEMLLADYS